MSKLVEKLKEFRNYELGLNHWRGFWHYVRNFRHVSPNEDVPKFFLKQGLNLSEITLTLHYLSNRNYRSAFTALLAFEALKYGFHKFDEYLHKNEDKIVDLFEKYFEKGQYSKN